jgi:hypothetical protein
MMWNGVLAAAAAILIGSEPAALSGPEIIAAFESKTITGSYADGMAFRESYHGNGRLNYQDPRGNFTGNWSITNNLFCTFYDQQSDGGSLAGGCFRIEKISGNCYDFLVAAGSNEEALNPSGKPGYTARASISGAASTCPSPLQV